MSKNVVNEVIEYLNEDGFDKCIPKILITRIRNCFELSEEDARKVYQIWKSEYMKPKIC